MATTTNEIDWVEHFAAQPSNVKAPGQGVSSNFPWSHRFPLRASDFYRSVNGGRPLLKFIAYASLFSCMPLPFCFHRRRDRKIPVSDVGEGDAGERLVVAVVGIVEFYTWTERFVALRTV